MPSPDYAHHASVAPEVAEYLVRPVTAQLAEGCRSRSTARQGRLDSDEIELYEMGSAGLCGWSGHPACTAKLLETDRGGWRQGVQAWEAGL